MEGKLIDRIQQAGNRRLLRRLDIANLQDPDMLRGPLALRKRGANMTGSSGTVTSK